MPPNPRAVSTRGPRGTADRRDAVARLRGTPGGPAIAHLEAPGAASVAGGPGLGERPRGAGGLPPADRPKAGGGAPDPGDPGGRSRSRLQPHPGPPAHSPGAHRREPAQTRDCGGGRVNNTPPPPASRNFEGETPHFRERGARRGPYQVLPSLVRMACLPRCRAPSSPRHVWGSCPRSEQEVQEVAGAEQGSPGVARAPLFVSHRWYRPAAGGLCLAEDSGAPSGWEVGRPGGRAPGSGE